MEKIFYTSIAGINFRATPEDEGQFLGYAQKDINNEYDPRAIGIYRVNGTLIGFVASKELDNFYEFFSDITPETQYIIFGNIKTKRKGEENFYIGNIGIINSQDQEEVEKIVNENFNKDFEMYGKTIKL